MSARPTHHYLDLTRKDRRGTLVLLSIILIICAVPFVYPLLNKTSAPVAPALDTALASLQIKKAVANTNRYAQREAEDQGSYAHPAPRYTSTAPALKGELFYFDPNTISAEGWKKLGLRDKTIATLMNYRNKGGKFREAADIKKIWGLFPDEAARLMPFVNIASIDKGYQTGSKNYSNDFSRPATYTPRSYEPVSINDSDTSAWIALPGIGSKLSQRIINFRDKLGGFYSIDQVGETFGLADSTFQKIKPFLQLSGPVKKININNATEEEFKNHPYIRWQLGNALFQYRIQHGAYKNIADIRKIMIVDENSYRKLSPYLSID